LARVLAVSVSQLLYSQTSCCCPLLC